MKIKNYITKQPVTVKKEDTAFDVAKKINDKDSPTVIVVEGGAPIGIITESDIVRRVVAKSLDPSSTKAASIMTKKPYTVSETDEVSEVYRVLIKNNYRHAPVIRDRKLCGIVSLKRLAQAIEEQMLDAYFGRQDSSGLY